MEMSMVDAILRAQKQYYYFMGVGSAEGACPSPDYRNIFMFVPIQHPIFTPDPNKRWCNYHELLHFHIKIMSSWFLIFLVRC